MIGSEKQIEWAMEIRAEVEAAISGYIMPKAAKGTPAQRAQLDSAIEILLGNESAAYWIEIQESGRFTRSYSLSGDALTIQGGEVRCILADIIRAGKAQ